MNLNLKALKIKRTKKGRERKREKKKRRKEGRKILQENGSSEVVKVLNANERNARVAVGRAEHSEERAKKYHSRFVIEGVRRGMQRCPGCQMSDVNETSQGKIEKIRHTEISTLDTRAVRDTSDTDHRAEVGDSCKREKKSW